MNTHEESHDHLEFDALSVGGGATDLSVLVLGCQVASVDAETSRSALFDTARRGVRKRRGGSAWNHLSGRWDHLGRPPT